MNGNVNGQGILLDVNGLSHKRKARPCKVFVKSYFYRASELRIFTAGF